MMGAIVSALLALAVPTEEAMKMRFYENIARDGLPSAEFGAAVVMMFDWGNCPKQLRELVLRDVEAMNVPDEVKSALVRHIKGKSGEK